jgi:hypothetical protein
MPWGKLDDGFDENRKVLALLADNAGDDATRLIVGSAIGMWTLCLSWANRNTRKRGRTPGLLPPGLPGRQLPLSAPMMESVIGLLVKHGLWIAYPDGSWSISGFAKSLPTAQTIEARRNAGARGAASRWGKPMPPDQDALPVSISSPPATAVPATPPARASRARVPEPDRADVDKVCAALADAIVANGSKRPTITQEWKRQARFLIDQDGRTPEQILNAIAWCQTDLFWRGNILSMPKLREKYDQLRLAAQAKGGSKLKGQDTRATNTPDAIDWDDPALLAGSA